MDHFKEEIIVKKNRLLNDVLYYLATAAMVLSGIYTIFMLQMIVVAFDWLVLATIVLAGAAALMLYVRKDRIRTEFEYTFTNGDVDYAMVFNNQKRKTLGTIRVQNVEAFGPVNSESFKRYLAMKNVKTSNWFLNRDSELYYFYFSKEEARRIIVFEPSSEMVELVKKYLPSQAYKA